MKEMGNNDGDVGGLQLTAYAPQSKGETPQSDNPLHPDAKAETLAENVKISIDNSLTPPNSGTPAQKNGDVDAADTKSSSSSSASSLCCLYRLVRFARHHCYTHRNIIKKIFLTLLLMAYVAFVCYCMYYKFGDEPSIRLLVLTIVVVLTVTYKVGKNHVTCSRWSSSIEKLFHDGNEQGMKVRTIFRRSLYVLSVVGVVIVVSVEVVLKRPENLVCLAGLAILIIFSFCISSQPEKVNWHAVFWGMMLQFWFAVLIRKTDIGKAVFEWLAERLVEFLEHSEKGSQAVFGNKYLDHQFIFSLMPKIMFFTAVISMLYYLGLIQVFIASFGKFLSLCLGTSPIESVNAAANVFLGLSEAPILIKPFMKDITNSELFAVMTGGFASIAGSLVWAFAAFGAPVDHIMTASFMSAPAALAFAKLIYPDERKPTITAEDAYNVDVSHHGSLIGALSDGVKEGLKLAVSVVINLMIYLALLEFVDQCLNWFFVRAGVEGFDFSKLVAYTFYPATYMMGFPAKDCYGGARLLGIKIFTFTLIAFMELGKVITNSGALQNYTAIYNDTWSYVGDDIFLEATNTTLVGGVLSERGGILATYMICGLSNIGAIGVAVGAYVAMAPSRKHDIMKIAPLALLAGNLACFSTACVAGLLITE